MSARHGDRPGTNPRDDDLAVPPLDRLEGRSRGRSEHERHEERDRSDEAAHERQSTRHLAGLP
jgi:hypothetical protein